MKYFNGIGRELGACGKREDGTLAFVSSQCTPSADAAWSLASHEMDISGAVLRPPLYANTVNPQIQAVP